MTLADTSDCTITRKAGGTEEFDPLRTKTVLRLPATKPSEWGCDGLPLASAHARWGRAVANHVRGRLGGDVVETAAEAAEAVT